MPSVATMRRRYRQHRNHQVLDLTPIPEDKSCREWNTSSLTTADGATLSETGHDLIDQERSRHCGLSPLRRSPALQKLAEIHASVMARREQVVHSVQNLTQLQRKLSSKMVGENVQRGDSLVGMHNTCMRELDINRSNVLGQDFVEYGVGVARGARDGKLYLVQYFR